MRQLKFRQWVNGRFHYWGFLEPDCFIDPINPHSSSQQFTGLLSKSGKEIYEGDIMSFVPVDSCKFNNPYKPFQIFWHEKEARFTDVQPIDRVDVIGNIWEHPWLLER